MIVDSFGIIQAVIWEDVCETELIEGKTSVSAIQISCKQIDETTDFEEPVTEASIASSFIEDCLTVLAVEKVQ